MLRSFLFGIISLAFVNVIYTQEDDPFVPRVENLLPLEDVFTTYRLPNTTRPNSYDVTLRTWVHEENFAFTGNVRIHITAVENTTSITLHHRYLTIEDIRLLSSDANSISPQVVSYSYNVTFEFLTAIVSEALTPGEIYILEIDFTGTLRTDDGGFYRSSYLNDEGSRIWLATTQFESTDARHAFPCYDEPNLKASFTIRITHDPSYTAISNMPEADRFRKYVLNKFQTNLMKTFFDENGF